MRATKLVEQALSEKQIYRDSDKHLRVRVWELQMGHDMNPKLKEWFIQKAIDPEMIRRTRQKLQEYGKYPASKEVDEQRFEKYKQVKAEIIEADGQKIARLL